MIDPNKYETVTGAARAAGIHRSTLNSAVERGELIAVKIGDLWIVDQDDVDRWKSDTTRRRGPKLRIAIAM